MKKLFLSFIILFCITLSAISQSFIGQSSTSIKNSVLKEYSSGISNVSDESNILTISFQDGHSALYFTNSNDLCKYYTLCYPIANYNTMRNMLQTNFTKVYNYEKWYYKDGEYYIYYKIVIDKSGTVFWIFVYPDFYESEIDQIINSL